MGSDDQDSPSDTQNMNYYLFYLLFITPIVLSLNQRLPKLKKSIPKKHHKEESLLTKLVRGSPNIVINIEKVEVAQPEEINLEFGQNVWGNLNIEKNKTENIQNGIKNDSRVNDKYLENFHNSSATNNTDGDMTASDDNNGGNNLTFFVHKLLSKRNSEDDNKMVNVENEHQNITTPDVMVSINSTEVPATYLKLQDIEIENYELNENYTDYVKYNISDINDDNDTLSEQETMTPKTIDLRNNHDNITVTETDYS